MRWTFGVGATLVLAFLISLIVRRNGAYYMPVDGWGVDLFEVSMGALCVRRYFDWSWRSSPSTGAMFPLILGAACLAWALGDVAVTIESIGGATPPVPTAESDPIVRVVHYGERDVVKLKAKLRYTTLIVLPKTEKILEWEEQVRAEAKRQGKPAETEQTHREDVSKLDSAQVVIGGKIGRREANEVGVKAVKESDDRGNHDQPEEKAANFLTLDDF